MCIQFGILFCFIKSVSKAFPHIFIMIVNTGYKQFHHVAYHNLHNLCFGFKAEAVSYLPCSYHDTWPQ